MNTNEIELDTPDQVVEFFNTLDSLDDQELWALVGMAQGEVLEMIQEELAARLAYRMPGSALTLH